MGRDVPVSTACKGFVAALFFAVGCAWRGPAPLQTFPDVKPTSDVVALDKAAWKLVAIQHQVVEKTDDGRLKIQLELANLSDTDLSIQVKAIFRDDKGMLLHDDTPFEMLVLPGNGSELFEATSLRKAASFTVQVKTP